MSKSLPKRIDPWLLFRHRQALAGDIDLADMPGLISSQLRQSGAVAVELSVAASDKDQLIVSGRASIELYFICQRCLQPISRVVDAFFSRVVVKCDRQLNGTEADAMVCEDTMELVLLVEEELILALPMIVKHDHCEMVYQNSDRVADDCQQPFAGLKDMMK